MARNRAEDAFEFRDRASALCRRCRPPTDLPKPYGGGSVSDDALKELTDAAPPPPQGGVFGTPSTLVNCLELGRAAACDVGQRLVGKLETLSRKERLKIVRAFRSQLIPAGKPGRKRHQEITAAHADWKNGLRGLALYRQHIPRFEQLGYWERKGKMHALKDAIRSRDRREKARRA